MDTAWLIRGLGQGKTTLDLLKERETIFQRLPQTTPENLQSNIKKYTIDPQVTFCVAIIVEYVVDSTHKPTAYYLANPSFSCN